jgi:hypothetical protein
LLKREGLDAQPPRLGEDSLELLQRQDLENPKRQPCHLRHPNHR